MWKFHVRWAKIAILPCTHKSCNQIGNRIGNQTSQSLELSTDLECTWDTLNLITGSINSFFRYDSPLVLSQLLQILPQNRVWQWYHFNWQLPAINFIILKTRFLRFSIRESRIMYRRYIKYVSWPYCIGSLLGNRTSTFRHQYWLYSP